MTLGNTARCIFICKKMDRAYCWRNPNERRGGWGAHRRRAARNCACVMGDPALRCPCAPPAWPRGIRRKESGRVELFAILVIMILIIIVYHKKQAGRKQVPPLPAAPKDNTFNTILSHQLSAVSERERNPSILSCQPPKARLADEWPCRRYTVLSSPPSAFTRPWDSATRQCAARRKEPGAQRGPW